MNQPHRLSRRTVLIAGGAVAAAGLSLPPAIASPGRKSPNRDTSQPPLAQVQPWDQTQHPLDRSTVEPTEQLYASFMTVVAPIANSVIDTAGPTYGFMDQGWWPGTNNDPDNARIMEQVALFARFYALNRPWNVYYQDSALLARLEAALNYYLGQQNPNGTFTEVLKNPAYDPNDPACTADPTCTEFLHQPLSATSFGSQVLTSTLADLKSSQALPNLYGPMESAIRNAIAWITDLTQTHWNAPVQYTNQTVAGLSGCVQAGDILGDSTLTNLALQRLDYLWTVSHAPAGHTLEPLGYDFPYEFYICLPDLGDIYRRTNSATALLYANHWADFEQNAMVWEPDGAGSFHFSAIVVRNPSIDYLPINDDTLDKAAMDKAFLADVPEMSPYFASSEQVTARRTAWATTNGPIPAIAKANQGNTLSPRIWLYAPDAPVAPSESARQQQISNNRVITQTRFTDVRKSGPGTGDTYLMVRRPNFYYCALHGPRPSDRLGMPYGRLRLGSGLIWHPRFGTVTISTNNGGQAWTTTAPDSQSPTGTVNKGLADAAGCVVTCYAGTSASGSPVSLDDLHTITGDLTTVTSFSGVPIPISSITPTVTTTLTDSSILETVDVGGPAVTRIPIMLRADDIIKDGQGHVLGWADYIAESTSTITIQRDGVTVAIEWTAAQQVMLAPTPLPCLTHPGQQEARRQRQLIVTHQGHLASNIQFTG